MFEFLIFMCYTETKGGDFMIASYQDHKRFLIMNIIHHFGQVSRTELARITGYQLPAIGAITKQLLDEKILIETGTVSAGLGRKRIMLQLNTGYLCAISISFSAHSISFTTAQLDGKILTRDFIDLAGFEQENVLLSQICGTLNQLMDALIDHCVIGIGVCSPTNDTAEHPNFQPPAAYRRLDEWIKKYLQPELQKLYSIPIEFYDGTALATLVEYNFGLAKGVRDFLCVELSNGFGCSIFCNGKPVTGKSGIAGELGHMTVDTSASKAQLCYCGKPGCLEQQASLPILMRNISDALQRKAYTKLAHHNGAFTLADIAAACEQSDALCCFCVKQTAREVGIAIANAVTLLNPAKVILYGQMLALGDYFIAQVRQTVLEHALPKLNLRSEDICVSYDLEDQLPLGAVFEVFAAYLKKDDFPWVYQLPQTADNAVSAES